MVSTISPLVKVAKNPWLFTTGVFVTSAAVAGALGGSLVGMLGTYMPHIPAVSALVFAALLAAMIDSGALPIPIPTPRRSVPESWWTRHPRPIAALMYGSILGMGVTTFVPFASFYFLLVASFVLGPSFGALIGFTYGISRSLPVLAAGLAIAAGVPPHAPGRWVVSARPLARFACSMALLSIAVTLTA